MKRYTAKEIEMFLKTMDSFLLKEVEIIIIGGTAAALAYNVTKATQDIDTWNSTKDLTEAYEMAKEKTSLDIPLGQVPVGDAPYNFEDRLIAYRPKSFNKLRILFPEIIDLILMKTLRGYEHDLEAIEEMIKNKKVAVDGLIKRYVEELVSAIGDKKKIDLNFLAVVERCYDAKALKSAVAKIGHPIRSNRK